MSKELKQPIIRFEALGKTFKTKNNSVKALENVTFDINQGDIFGIIGMSGAGKSTLVRCINFLEKPTEGTVYFDGKDLSKLDNKDLRSIRRDMGMIFQQFNLLMQRTAGQNIAFPMELAKLDKKYINERVKELLEIVGLSDKINAYPSQLSGGQRQRVAIARALATNPKVLLCDEATSALDPATTRSILALLKDINQRLGITIVIITHEMSVIEEICSHVAIIDSSKIAEVGRVEEVFAHPKTLSAQRLVYPESKRIDHFVGTRCCRIIFDGNSSFEPVIANMVLESKAPVNILFADTRNIDGKAFGQMIIQLPEDNLSANRVLQYLNSRNLIVEEVREDVGSNND